jgi:hypothetical protein
MVYYYGNGFLQHGVVVQSKWGFTGKSIRPGLDPYDEVRSESNYVANSQCGQLKIWESIGV